MEDTNKEREAFYGKENKQMRMIKGEKKNGEEEKRWQCSRARERERRTGGMRERDRKRQREGGGCICAHSGRGNGYITTNITCSSFRFLGSTDK